MANLTLFGSVEVSRTWWVEWTLRELGLQFHNEPQGHLDPVWKAPAYLGINPNGLVPSIKDGDFVLWESMAINLYLAKNTAVVACAPRHWKEKHWHRNGVFGQ
jgi:glutathione S-transferase